MTKNKSLLTAATIQRKEFTYNIGTIELKFTLRTDIKTELKGFKECMERGIKDIDAELEAMK